MYEPCIVSFIDVLGFRDIIETRPPAEIIKILETLEKSTKPPKEPIPRRMKEFRLYSQAFAFTMSDAVIRARVYETQYRDGAFFCELLDLLHAQLELINSGVLIRAGVTVGEAYVDLTGEGPVFGPAVVRAYEIESQEAIFPRIVVDDLAIELLREDQNLLSENNPPDEEIAQILDFLSTGEDGTLFIDYLKAGSSEFDGHEDQMGFLARHRDLIVGGQSKTLDPRTKRKYDWLVRYHNAYVAELHTDAENDESYRQSLSEDLGIADPIAFLDAMRVT